MLEKMIDEISFGSGIAYKQELSVRKWVCVWILTFS